MRKKEVFKNKKRPVCEKERNIYSESWLLVNGVFALFFFSHFRTLKVKEYFIEEHTLDHFSN